jgi:gas vesicle GvpC-like protein
MKISQTVDFGQVENTFVSTWKSDNEIELRKGEDKVIFTMSEEDMKQLHKRLGDKLTSVAAERLAQAKELAQEQSEDE